jgi:hypothetical protein
MTREEFKTLIADWIDNHTNVKEETIITEDTLRH